MEKKQKLILVGDSSFAQVAYEYFTYDSDYEVVAFSVEREYLKHNELFGKPVIAFEDLPRKYNPQEYAVFVALVYTKLNRTRTRLYLEAKRLGYKIASYVSDRAFIWRNARLGEHCFIFENNVIQPFVEIGNNVILWSGNHVGHHSVIDDNCFLSSHVVISGHCEIGKSCFFGVNSTVADRVQIASDSIIGAGALILKDTIPTGVYKGLASLPAAVRSYQIFKMDDKDLERS